MTAGSAHSSGHPWPRPVFRVARLEASVAYYRDRLGFEVDWLDNSTRPPTCAQVSRDGITVILDERASFPKAAVPSVLSVTLDDSPAAPRLEELHQDLVRSGGRIVRGPFAVPWDEELRQMDVEDLDGNVLMVWGHSAAAAGP